MLMNSEFESVYHGLIYNLLTLVNAEQQDKISLLKEIWAYMDEEEVSVHLPFVEALLNTDHSRHLEIFEVNGQRYTSLFKDLPAIDFSTLEKHYLSWILKHDNMDAFISKETNAKVQNALMIDKSIFEDKINLIQTPGSFLDALDKQHLLLLIKAIENEDHITYRYVDDEGNVFQNVTKPFKIQYDMQNGNHYLVHQPQSRDTMVKGLLRRFSALSLKEGPLDMEGIREDLTPIEEFETFTLRISKSSSMLRKALVELSVFERTIKRQGDTFNIDLKIFPFDKSRVMSKIRSLQPELFLISPIDQQKDLIQDMQRVIALL